MSALKLSQSHDKEVSRTEFPLTEGKYAAPAKPLYIGLSRPRIDPGSTGAEADTVLFVHAGSAGGGFFSSGTKPPT